MDLKRYFRGPFVAVLVMLLLFFIVFAYANRGVTYTPASTSRVVADIYGGHVKSATLIDKSQTIEIVTNGNPSQRLQASWVGNQGQQIATELQKNPPSSGYNVQVPSGNTVIGVIFSFLPYILITKDTPKTTFADVAGADEAIEELQEIKEFLQTPGKFQAIGAKIPKGVLLYGPPGTGKTLLARAVAGEAGVPFYSISGSDFVEMFVGVGASRVRDLFEQAKANAPAIVFVDEIDAVGRQRGAGLGGGHDEREQTLNQLLVEMDGFDARGGIILIAATNRPDILDPALLRPGRFDRQIPVSAPDLMGRRKILEVHSKGKPLDPDADLDGLAKRTVGMSGADLANVINEAALLTARMNGTMINSVALEESVDRVIGGPARKSRIISEKEKKITAYHEGGHALAAWAMPDIEPVYKLTILPRGRTGGHALLVPEDDKDLMTRSEMIGRLVFAMGGRTAEELVFHEPTTGAVSDIEQATKIAKAMVTEYGMSARLGAVKYGQDQGDPFLGRSMGHAPDYSLEVAHEIDEEVRALIEAAHTEAWDVL